MLGGMLVWRAVATPRPAAFLARPQVDPAGADLHTFFALALCRLFNNGDRRDVTALVVWH